MRCYNSMETTKRRHFELLTLLEERKKKFNLSPKPQETELLSCLLDDHNTEVKAFQRASQELKTQNPQAHAALFEYIGRINAHIATGGH